MGQDLVVNTTLMELYASWSRKQSGVKCCTIDILCYVLGICLQHKSVNRTVRVK